MRENYVGRLDPKVRPMTIDISVTKIHVTVALTSIRMNM